MLSLNTEGGHRKTLASRNLSAKPCRAVTLFSTWQQITASGYAIPIRLRANVEGTRAQMRPRRHAAFAVSSIAVQSRRWPSRNRVRSWTKRRRFLLADMVGHYKRSKFMAEQIALEAGRKGANVVVVNPTTPVGERDIKPTPTGRIIVDILNRKFPAYVDTGLNLADVKEVAQGHLLAMEKARPGERYILGGENLTLEQILDKLAAITGLPSPTMKVPHAVAMGFAAFDRFFTGIVRGKEPGQPLTQ